MNYQEEIFYSIALRACPLVGDVNFNKLVTAAGSAKEVWMLSKSVLNNVSGIGKKIVQGIGNEDYLKLAEKEMEFCLKHSIKIKLRHLGELPKLLLECNDAPALLYQKGEFPEDKIPLSIVGTRNITAYGKKFVEDFIAELKGEKVSIISGLALGVDGHAHKEALRNEIPTVAVLAHGLHTVYPSSHAKLAAQILEEGGALISEFNSNEKPDREHFLQRNRIIAGISSVTIIVETAYGGGSINTGSYANQYNREVFALPGKVTDKYSQGCNMLISKNKARIIDGFEEIKDELGINNPKEKIESLFKEKSLDLTSQQRMVYDTIFDKSPVILDDLSLKTSIPTHQLLSILLELELKGIIKSLSGKQYSCV